MKSLKDYSLNISEDEYHAFPAWSYSTIARYAKEGFSSIATLHEPFTPTPSMEFGSLFDSLITDYDNVVNKYAVSDMVPPPAEKNVLDNLLSKTDVPFQELSDSTIGSAIMECSYYPKWKYDTQYSHISEYSEYYDIRRTGRRVVSTVDMYDAQKMANAFRSNPYISSTLGTTETGIEVLYQLKYVVKVKLSTGEIVKVKFMPDAILVNHNDKTVQMWDVKTSAMPAYDFVENFTKLRYDIQAQLYSQMMRVIMDNTAEYKDYTILPYIFADISRSDMQPVPWVYDQTDESQLDGFSFGDYTYKNWRTLLEEIIAYEKAEAKVPSYISLDEPNSIIDMLNSKKNAKNISHS